MKQERFSFKENTLYMCGHSLGPMPKQAQKIIERCLKDWAQEGVLAWNKSDWIHLPYKMGQLIAPLIGAKEDEVIVCDSTSVNLFKVLHSALRLNPKRRIIITSSGNFPADLYIAQGIAHFNNNIELCYVPDDSNNIIESLTEEVAVLTLAHVDYRTGLIYDMREITERAHELGIIVVWDLSHSVGVVPLSLTKDNIDFAVGCTYKYLNGGPGAPSFVYANRRHHKNLVCPIYGWIGHRAPFTFSKSFENTPGVGAFLGGTPYILSMKALEGALGVFDDIVIERLYKDTINNGNYLIDLLNQKVPELVCVSSRVLGERGGHIAFKHDQAYAISRALIAEDLICDYRNPDLIRLSMPSLYLDLHDMQKASLIIEKVIRDKLYQKAEFQQKLFVT